AEPVGLPTSASAVGEHSSGTWAVVIGINDYPGTEYDLQSAINDSNDVTQALSGFGVAPDRQLVLQGQDANRAGIRRSLEWLKAHAGPDATAVFFYAGHVSKQRGGEAIVAADGGTLSDAELAASLDGLQAAKTWIGIAACYGGGFTEVMKPGRVLVAAASADEVAYENLNFKRSYLVEYMVRRAMIGNGIDTVQDAFTAAQQALRNEFPGRVAVQFDQMTQALDLSASPAGQPTTNRPSR
ncbi:MAG: caspase family protein, partial [Actinomycetota bacterium]|nr:caspase family protein [Actinomycetota bacterium]